MQHLNSQQLHSMLRIFRFGKYMHLPKKGNYFIIMLTGLATGLATGVAEAFDQEYCHIR